MHVCFKLLAVTVWQSIWVRPFRPGRVLAMLLLVGWFLSFELALSFFLALDYLFFPGFRRTAVTAPVFIIGNPRSGTSHLFRLMALDEEQFTSLTFLEIVFPAVTQRWCFSILRRIDPYIGHLFRRWRKRIEARRLEPSDAVHRSRFNEPEEDDVLAVHAFARPIALSFFGSSPAMRSLMRFDELPDSLRHKVTAFYKACLQRHLFWAGRGRTLLSKNPTFPGKLRTIHEFFPDARFVYILRNPEVSIASTISLFTHMMGRYGSSAPTSEEVRWIYETFCYYYQYAFAELERLPPTKYCIVEYEQLISDPMNLIKRIYESLGLPCSPAFEERLRQAAEKAKEYRSRNMYMFEVVGVTPQDIRAALPLLFERFQFQETVVVSKPADNAA